MSAHVVDSSGEDFFLIHVERDGQLYCHKLGMASDVVEAVSDREWARVTGESEDVSTFYHLGFGSPTLVSIGIRRHAPIGFVEVILSWSQRENGTSKIIDRTESLYYPIPEA